MSHSEPLRAGRKHVHKNLEATPSIPFSPSELGSLGVEMEWFTVSNDSGMQTPAAETYLSEIPQSPRIKQELFTSILEINTGIHHDSRACVGELQALYQQASAGIAMHDASLLSAGTHPFSAWHEQIVSQDERYNHLIDRLQWVARRFNICGIHVHIGMPNGDACIHSMNALMPVLPVFLAISANSPFWRGKDTGLHACRIKIFEGLSQGGMPFYFESWKDFEHCAGRLIATGSIDSIRDIWWEMRPHPDFGTLEIRIGDMPAIKEDALAYIAYVRAEVMAAAHKPQPKRVHPSLIRENRWRACRYGMQAEMIDPHNEELVPVLDWIATRLDKLEGANQKDLSLVADRLEHWRTHGDGAERQRRIRARHAGPLAMVKSMQEDGWHGG